MNSDSTYHSRNKQHKNPGPRQIISEIFFYFFNLLYARQYSFAICLIIFWFSFIKAPRVSDNRYNTKQYALDCVTIYTNVQLNKDCAKKATKTQFTC